jgi:hypothetical protein
MKRNFGKKWKEIEKHTRMLKILPKDCLKKIKIGFDSMSSTNEVSLLTKEIQFGKENSSLDA